MFSKRRIILLSIMIGLLIGLFPLLTGQVKVQRTKVVSAIALKEPTLQILIDEKLVEINGSERSENVLIVDDYTYIPVRYLEKLGGKVQWDEQNRKVYVEMKN